MPSHAPTWPQGHRTLCSAGALFFQELSAASPLEAGLPCKKSSSLTSADWLTGGPMEPQSSLETLGPETEQEWVAEARRRSTPGSEGGGGSCHGERQRTEV